MAIDLNVHLSSAHRMDIGLAYAAKGDFITGLTMFESTMDLEPRNVHAMCNAAQMALKCGRKDSAWGHIEMALDIAPHNPQALGISAMVAQDRGLFDMARSRFSQSLKLDPTNTTTLLSYAYFLLFCEGDFTAALDTYTQARDLNPLDLNGRFNRSLCLMTMAKTVRDWKEALDEYELRHFLTQAHDFGPIDKPLYAGPKYLYTSSRLLMVAEQGVGDSIMMARYARARKWGYFDKVYILCKPFMVGLMGRMDGVDGAYSELKSVPEFDYHIPMMSLPRATGYPEGDNEAYAAVTSYHGAYLRGVFKIEKPLADAKPGNIKIGICWKGNHKHGNDRFRSMSPWLFADAFGDIAGAEFYSLMESHDNLGKPVFAHSCDIQTPDELANLIQQMDLVVTVDTAQLHIAGAMGIPTFALIPLCPDWRWGLGSDKTEWYPSVTLFRSEKALQWDAVMQRVHVAVAKFIEEHRAGQA